MAIEEIMNNCRPIMLTKNKKGDARCFFEDETNKILYIFGPSGFVRQGFKNSKSDELQVVEFEDGPYIGVGDEILSGKFALAIGITYEEGVPLVSVNYGTEPKKKRKKKNK